MSGELYVDIIHYLDTSTDPTLEGQTQQNGSELKILINGTVQSFALAPSGGLTPNSMLYSGATGRVTATAAPTNGQLLIGSTGTTPVLSTLTGTSNQVNVVNGAGSITLSTPQDIHTGASPTFSGINLTTLTLAGGKFAVDANGDITKINNVTYSWPSSQGAVSTILVNDGAGNLTWTTLGSLTEWNDLQDPSANLSLSHAAYTTAFTWGNATAANNLFTLSDTASNTGTGFLLSVETQSGSTLKPFRVVAVGNQVFSIDAAGLTQIGASNEFRVDSSGNLIRINDVAYSWPASQGAASTILVNDGAGNLTWTTLGSLTEWNDLQDPSASLSLSMAAYTTTFTWGAATGSNNLFTFVDTTSNTGTGFLISVETASSSTLKPFRVVVAGNQVFSIDATGLTQIGTSNEFRVDSTGNLIRINDVTYSWPGSQGSADRYLRNDGSGNLTWAEISLTAGVTGVLPIASGGTNSSTALNNDRIMVSSGGAIVEAGALSDGQLLIGSTGAAPVAAAISGTSNQVTVTNGAGSITLSTPQDIHTGASPTFDGLTLTTLDVGGSKFTVDSNGNLTKVNNVAYSWPGSQGSADSVLVNDGSGNLVWTTLGSLTQWNDLQDPSVTGGNLSLSMDDITTTFTWGATTGSSNLFTLVDTASNTGTGYLFSVETASGSTLKPFRVVVTGNQVFSIDATGLTQIGTSNEFRVDSTGNLVRINDVAYSWPGSQGSADRYLRNDSSGNLTWAQISLTAGVTGVLPIANGGTNSSTALNNDRIMVSSGGAIVEAAALSDGQLLIGSTGAAPVAAAITGTSNQVNVTNGAGSITLSTPQDIHTGASPTFDGLTLTTLDVGGSKFLVDANGNLTKINNVTYSWPASQGSAESFLVNDGSGNLSWASVVSFTQWNDLQDPDPTGGDLSLDMGDVTTTFTWGAATDPASGPNNLFTLTDSVSNTGTGYLFSLETASGSTLKPFRVVVTGNQVFSINNNGLTQIGTSNEFRVDSTGNLVRVNDVTYSWPGSQGSADRYLRNDGSGNLTWAEISLTAGVTGVLPVANGGTNSSTALNNDRIMVSSGGAIVEAAALSDGQLLIGSTGAAPVAAAISGTANQINVTNGAGSITLSTPQDIHTGASPTFNGLTLTTLDVGASKFTVDSNGNLTKLNDVAYSWPGSQGSADSFLVNDGSGNLSWATVVAFTQWNDLQDPDPTGGDLSLDMGDITTTFTWGANSDPASGANNLFTLADSVSNTGTGYLFSLETASGSSLKPFRVIAAGSQVFSIDATGLIQIGASNEFRVDSSGDLVRVNDVPYSWPGSQGSADRYLKNDGSGNLTWAQVSLSEITGVLPIANGGTGKSTISADTFWYASALDTLSEASITAAGRAILDDANAAAQRTTLGVPELNGFPNRTDSTISYSGGIFTIAPAVSSFSFWSGGTQYTKNSSQTVAIPSDNTLYYVYFDTSGALQQTTSPWDILSDNVPVALIYRISSSLAAVGDERHSAERDRDYHRWAHNTIGARYDFVTGGLTGTFTDTTLSVTSGAIYDEDIKLPVSGPVTTCRLWYRTGAVMTFEDSITTPYKASAGVIQYDNAGTLTNVTNNRYVANYVYATNDTSDPIYVLVGQAQHITLANARDETPPSFANLSTAEWKLIYRVIYRNVGGTPTYIENADYRVVSTGPATGFVPTDHGTLTGLADSDHPASAIAFTATDRLLGRQTAGAGAGEEIVCTAAGRALIDDADTTTQRNTLSLGTGDSPTFTGLTLTTLDVGASKFTVDSNGNLTKVNNVTYSWPGSQGSADSFLVNDGSGNLTWASVVSFTQWNDLQDPGTTGGDLSLNMGDVTTTFTWGAATDPASGPSDLFTFQDSINNSGTGYLVTIGTASGSSLKPFQIIVAGNQYLDIDSTGLLKIGTSDEFRIDSSGNLIRINDVTYSWPGSQGSADRYLRNDGSGNLTWAEISLTAGVTGVLPIASGGTNSSTALNNDRIMVSSGGAIVEAAALSDGQLLIGSTGAAPVAAAISGTSNQVTVTNGAGTITLSTPQDIHIGASPTFNGLTLTSLDVGASKFTVDSNGNLTKINNVTYSWPGSQGAADSFLVNDGSGNLSWATVVSFTQWNDLQDPDPTGGDLALSMGEITTTFTWGAATDPASGPSNLFTLADSINNTGTGYLFSLETASGSTLKPFRVVVTDNQVFSIDANGLIQIGTSNEFRVDSSGDLVRVNDVTYSWPGSQGSADRYLKNDGSGNLTWAQISLTAGVTGVLPVANGGTNSSTALNNNRVMVSSSGAIVEAGALSDGQLLIGSTGNAPVVAAITGTANRVTVSNGAGSITLSTPQDIHTGASPTFTGMTLSGLTQNSVLFAGPGGVISEDTTNFVWDNSTKRLGVGTNSPQSALQVNGGPLRDGSWHGGIEIQATAASQYSSLYFANQLYDVATPRYSAILWTTSTSGNDANDLEAIIYVVPELATAAYMGFCTSNTVGSSPPSEKMRITSDGKIGIGATAVPQGGIGAAMLALDGAATSVDGPHVQFTTASDDYPLFQMLNWSHDNIALNFDCYYDVGAVAFESSDIGSNFRIYKVNDLLSFNAASGISQGSTVSFTTGNSINIDTSGNLLIGVTSSAASTKLQVFQSGTGYTSDIYNIYFDVPATVTMDCTAAARNTYGTLIYSQATKSAGVNTLSNYALYCYASGGDVNVPGYFISDSGADRARVYITNYDSTNKSGVVNFSANSTATYWEVGSDLEQNGTDSFYVWGGGTGATRLYMDSEGNTGISETSLLGRLHIEDGGTSKSTVLYIVQDDSTLWNRTAVNSTFHATNLVYGDYSDDSGHWYLGTIAATSLNLYTNSNWTAPQLRIASGGQVSINTGTTDGNLYFDVNGDIAFRKSGSNLTLSNGDNDDINVDNYSFFEITGPNNSFAVTGFTGGVDGKMLVLYNGTDEDMTVANEDGGSTAANRIITMTGGDLTTTAQGLAVFQYDDANSRWLCWFVST